MKELRELLFSYDLWVYVLSQLYLGNSLGLSRYNPHLSPLTNYLLRVQPQPLNLEFSAVSHSQTRHVPILDSPIFRADSRRRVSYGCSSRGAAENDQSRSKKPFLT